MATADLTTWATIGGTWALVVGTLGFAYWQLRQAQRLHSATTLLDLRERFYNDRMRVARREFAAWLLRPVGSPEVDNWEAAIFFELMGSLTRSGSLEVRTVWSAFGSWITAYYLFLTQPVDRIAQWRRDDNDPLILAEFEWLARRMFAYERRLGPGAAGRPTSVEDARSVLENELHVADSHADH
jgi:hypothetical protein